MREKKRTELRISKSGKKYWINPELYHARLERERKQRAENPSPKGPNVWTRDIPYCHDKNNEAYMRYWEKKCAIRKEYPNWKEMDRTNSIEYYSKVINLLYTDNDYKQYKWETRTYEEREDDQWWEAQKEKERNYDGRNDEYNYVGG